MKKSKVDNRVFRNAGLMLMVVVFIVSGCATKEYVGTQVSPISSRVSQAENRIGQAETQISELSNSVAGNGAKISSIESELANVDSKAEQALANFSNLKLERRLVLDRQEGANFGFDSAALSDEAKQKIDEFLNSLKGDIDGGNPVFLVAGHTDNTGSEDYNYELGKSRADMVCRYLITQKQVDPLRVVTVSYGESTPVADNSTRDGRAQNRRVEILAYSEAINSK